MHRASGSRDSVPPARKRHTGKRLGRGSQTPTSESDPTEDQSPQGSLLNADCAPCDSYSVCGLSAVFTVESDTAVTGAPTGLTATANGPEEIDLSWTAPSSIGGDAITGYKIEFSINGGTTWNDLVADTGATDTTHSHSSNLSAGNTRHYRVSAINSGGAGPASNVAVATTAAADMLVSNTGQSGGLADTQAIGDQDKTTLPGVRDRVEPRRIQPGFGRGLYLGCGPGGPGRHSRSTSTPRTARAGWGPWHTPSILLTSLKTIPLTSSPRDPPPPSRSLVAPEPPRARLWRRYAARCAH